MAHFVDQGRACTGSELVELLPMSMTPELYPACRDAADGMPCPAGLNAPTEPGYPGMLGLTVRGRLKLASSLPNWDRALPLVPALKRPRASRLRDIGPMYWKLREMGCY